MLLAKAGPLKGNVYTLGGRTLIGRDAECDIQIVDQGVSRKHACVLELDDGSVMVRDLKSHNGTHVGNQKVVETVLNPGSEFNIGESCFEYRIAPDDVGATQELDIKLMSGPAQASTVNDEMSPVERDEIIALVRAERSTTVRPVPACCDDPLSARARKEKWKHCPACGAVLTR